MELALELARAKDTKERMAGVERLHQLLEASRKTLSPSEVTSLVDVCLDLLKDNNFRVSQGGLQALASTAVLSGEHFKLHFNALVPAVVERLGDEKQPVRDAARRLLLTLMEVSSLTIIVERAGSYAWMHRSWRVREEFARTVTSAIGLFASTELPLQRAILPPILQMLNDPNPAVREAAVSCIEEMYTQAGPQFLEELNRHHLPTAMLRDINARLERIEPKIHSSYAVERTILTSKKSSLENSLFGGSHVPTAMDFHLSPSSSSSSSSHHRNPNSNSAPNGHSSDPMHSWWESISRARSRIHLLSSLLPSSTTASASADEDPLSSLADTDRPARSLLLSSAAYSSLSAALSAPSSGTADDPLCQWLYDTYLSSDPDLRLVVLSYLPLIASVYLHRIHHPASDAAVSVSGFEAVLLAVYTSEAKARNGKAITVSIPDLSQPSLYHSPRNPKSASPNLKPSKPSIGVLSPPLEPQMAVKSTKRACIVGVALDCYYKQISQMPSWSKLDFCKFAAIWAGGDCPCTSDFDRKPENFVENNEGRWSESGFADDIRIEAEEINPIAERVKDLTIGRGDSTEMVLEDFRFPLPWELLQPVLRILGHCLLGPLNVDDVKDAASMVVRRLYARASHDLLPQAILATRSLIHLDKRTRDAAKAAVAAAANGSASTVNTPSKAKKPEILLVSK